MTRPHYFIIGAIHRLAEGDGMKLNEYEQLHGIEDGRPACLVLCACGTYGRVVTTCSWWACRSCGKGQAVQS